MVNKEKEDVKKEIVLKDDPGFDTEQYIVKKIKDIKMYSELREHLDKFIKDKLVEGVDYGETDPRSKTRTLKKAGAEKIDILLGLEPVFMNDKETWEMFGKKDGTICLVCFLMTHKAKERAIELMCSSGVQYAMSICAMFSVGEGRAAGNMEERRNSNPNDLIKRVQKRAQVDATLRVSGLSERFTQDIEEDIYGGKDDIEGSSKEHKSISNVSGGEGKGTGKEVIVVPKDKITVGKLMEGEDDEDSFLAEMDDETDKLY